MFNQCLARQSFFEIVDCLEYLEYECLEVEFYQHDLILIICLTTPLLSSVEE